MLCLLLVLGHLSVISTQTIDFSTSVTWIQPANETIDLNCTITDPPLDFTLTWFGPLTPNGTQNITEAITNATETETYERTWDLADSKISGEYYCTLTDENGTTLYSNRRFVHLLNLTITLHNASTPLYQGSEVRIEVEVSGDLDLLECEYSGRVYSFDGSRGQRRMEWSVIADTTGLFKCSATYSKVELFNKWLEINVTEPAWSEWSEFSETCGIAEEFEWRCVRVRRRECVPAHLECDGEPADAENCLPDDCEPIVTEWGGWGKCAYNASNSCRKTRQRFCVPATNSTKTCNETLTDEAECTELSECDIWTKWGEWSDCLEKSSQFKECVKSRRRECALTNGMSCQASPLESHDCILTECNPAIDDRWANGQLNLYRSYEEEFSLGCNVLESAVSGYSDIAVTWKRNGILVRGPERWDSHHTTGTLSENLTERTEGVYNCCARNRFGQTCNNGWNVRLLDYGPVDRSNPNDPSVLHIADGNNHSISCPLEGWQLDYKWFREVDGRQELLPENTSQLLIINMRPELRGSYFCCATDFTSGSNKKECSKKVAIVEPENVQRKYLILTISLIVILIIGLVLYIACVHTSKMNGLKRRFRHVFKGSHTKYNGLQPYEAGHIIQRSQSYLKRLSKSRPLSKSELSLLVEKLAEPEPEYHESSDLSGEFEGVPNNCILITKTPAGTESKNRYVNVLPNPHSRVLLSEINGDPTSTYINGNYVRGYKLVPKDYIATQGPLPSTTYDFWRLLWEERCRIIVMTTGLIENARPKCNLYWPAGEQGGPARMGAFEMEQLGTYPSRYFTLTILKMSKDGDHEKREERILYHLWYHSWPDFGVPEDTTPFLDFVECVRAFKRAVEPVPVLVHCSAGIGRTGTFVAVNLGIEELEGTGRVDPLGYLCQLRQDRGGMIQTLDQYLFVYRALHAYQQRVAERVERGERAELPPRIRSGFYSLRPDNPLLPASLALPVVTDEEGCRVGEDFIATLTQSQRFVPRYSESGGSINSYKHSAESVGPPGGGGSTTSSPKHSHSQKPLLPISPPSPAGKKQKRRSKVKSLFFPSSAADKLSKCQPISQSSYNVSLEMEPAAQRSISLSNVKLSKSRDSVHTVSLASSSVCSEKRQSVGSSSRGTTEAPC